jgi:hypothetical protein
MVQPAESPLNHCQLSVAGKGVSVASRDSQLIAELARRYRDFPCRSQPLLSAVVHLQASAGAPLNPDPELSFSPTGMQFWSQGFSGSINSQGGAALLTLDEAQAVEGVDYFLRLVYALLVFQAGGFLFHAAGVVHRGAALLFFGHSGSGKTTICRLSSGDLVLNDDLLVLLPEGAGWVAHATPFWNPSQVQPAPHSAPVTGLYRLEQDRQVYRESLSRAQALAEVVSNVPVIPADPARSGALLLRCARLLAAVPAYRLHFLPDDSFWNIIET